MALPRSERSSRDDAIIRLMLFFFRNIAIISPPPNTPSDSDDQEVSRSATIDAFHQQDVFALLLTISSNMGEDFNLEDTTILEVLFHLLKGVEVEKVFMDDRKLEDHQNSELKDILRKEKGMHRDYARNAPTRHNRFGTMIWVKRADEKLSTVSGQDILGDNQHALQKMDKTKRWKKPRYGKRDHPIAQDDFDVPVTLDSSARKHLRTFVEEFLDSGFNPLFSHIRRAIEREADRVIDYHSKQFFYVVSWFLEAERVRRRTKKEAEVKRKMQDVEEVDSFALVASVLNQETFITLNRSMQRSYDMKEWQDLNANMRCFTQILLTIQEMAISPLEEDQEIAENIQNRIFYEETTHDRIIGILRGYKDQGFGYLNACTELSHVFLRMLERYSKENVDMQVRSRRRARRKRKESKKDNNQEDNANGDDSEAEDLEQASQVAKERKFDFNRFATKFSTQKCVDTFVAFTAFYKDLNTEQLKRAHRFFYRVAFKLEATVLLYRLDIISLFYRMIKGPEGLDSSRPAYKDWEELVRQLLKRLFKKLDQRPGLVVELLFSKINSTLHFLEYGFEKQTIKATPRAPAELEIKPWVAESKEQQIAIVIGALSLDGKIDLVHWIDRVLEDAVKDRKSFEEEHQAFMDAERSNNPDFQPSDRDPKVYSISMHLSFNSVSDVARLTIEQAVRPENDACRIAMFKNATLRLLMSLLLFQRIGVEDTPDNEWIIPGEVTASELSELHAIVDRNVRDPVTDEGDVDPRDNIRRRPVAQSAEDEDDDNASTASVEDEDFLFPAGPSISNPTNPEETKKKKRLRRKKDTEDGDDLDLDVEAEKQAKRKRISAKEKRFKSAVYVHDSDDGSDEEADRQFFAREEERRKNQSLKVLQLLRDGDVNAKAGQGVKKRKSAGTRDEGARKRQRGAQDVDEVLSDEDMLFISGNSSSPRHEAILTDEEVVNDEDTPLSSAEASDDESGKIAEEDTRLDRGDATKTSAKLDKDVNMGEATINDEDDEDDDVVAAPRRRVRAGFVVDSDSE